MVDKESASRRKGANFPASRIKRIMLSNEDIGKITPSTPVVLGRALELFLAELLDDTISACQTRGSAKISKDDVRFVVEKNEKYGFLSIKSPE